MCIRCLLNASDRRRINNLTSNIRIVPAFHADIMVWNLRMRDIVMQFIIFIDNILHFNLAILEIYLIRGKLLLFHVLALEFLQFLFIIIDGILFNRWRARPIRLHVLRIIRSVARLEIHRLILLLLIRSRWLQRIF